MEDKIVILGAGVSGNGTAILAKKHGYDVFVSDKSPIANGTKEHLINWELIGKKTLIHFLKCREQNI